MLTGFHRSLRILGPTRQSDCVPVRAYLRRIAPAVGPALRFQECAVILGRAPQ